MLRRLLMVLVLSWGLVLAAPARAVEPPTADLVKAAEKIKNDVSAYSFWGRWGGVIVGTLAGAVAYWYVRNRRSGHEKTARVAYLVSAFVVGAGWASLNTIETTRAGDLHQCLWGPMLVNENGALISGQFQPTGFPPEAFSTQERVRLAEECLAARDDLPFIIGSLYKHFAARSHLCNQWDNCPLPKFELVLSPMLETGFWAMVLAFAVAVPLVRLKNLRG